MENFTRFTYRKIYQLLNLKHYFYNAQKQIKCNWLVLNTHSDSSDLIDRDTNLKLLKNTMNTRLVNILNPPQTIPTLSRLREPPIAQQMIE